MEEVNEGTGDDDIWECRHERWWNKLQMKL